MNGSTMTQLWITPQFADESRVLLAWSHVRDRFELPQLVGGPLTRKLIWQRLAERAGTELARSLVLSEQPTAELSWPLETALANPGIRTQVVSAFMPDVASASQILRELDWEWVSIRDVAIGFTTGARTIDPSLRSYLELTGRHAVAQGTSERTLSIGVTGHRDLFSDDVPVLFDKLHQAMEDLAKEFPEHELRVLSPLAEGADQLLADVALERGLPLWSPLPLPVELYETDFTSAATLTDFRETLNRTTGWFCLPAAEGTSQQALQSLKACRDDHYRRLGRYIVNRSDVLLALWDGHPSTAVGGTADVLRYAFEAPRRPGHRLLVRHVPTRRMRQRGSAY